MKCFVSWQVLESSFSTGSRDAAEYFLSGVRVQNSKMFKDLNLPLSCQVLVSEEDHTAFIDKCSKLIQLLRI
jgi:hypothetical protein